MKKNVAAALAGALSLSLAAGVVAADKAASDVAVEKTVKAAEGTCGAAAKAGEGSCGAAMKKAHAKKGKASKAKAAKVVEGKCDLAEDFLSLSDDSPIRFIEAAPENWLKMGGRARKQFDRVAERLPLALHGLSMSLGGQAPLDTALIDGIKEMMRRYDCTFFSDHLSYCHDGGHLYDLLPLPFTEEMVQHTARRIREVQDRLGCRIAVENTSYYLHSPLAEMNEVEFLNAVAREADCGIHLDVNNIYVNAVNHGLLSPETFLENVDAGRVCYIHIAGHDVETPELLIDTHGAAVLPTVWDLLELAYTKLPTIPPTLLERDFNFPPFGELEAEVAKIADYQTRAGKEYRRAIFTALSTAAIPKRCNTLIAKNGAV